MGRMASSGPGFVTSRFQVPAMEPKHGKGIVLAVLAVLAAGICLPSPAAAQVIGLPGGFSIRIGPGMYGGGYHYRYHGGGGGYRHTSSRHRHDRDDDNDSSDDALTQSKTDLKTKASIDKSTGDKSTSGQAAAGQPAVEQPTAAKATEGGGTPNAGAATASGPALASTTPTAGTTAVDVNTLTGFGLDLTPER